MNSSLVLDIDGVLVRDPLLLAHVKSNIIEYVRQKVPSCSQPARLNSVLYKRHGHTARGLQQTFKVDTSDFNQKVYDGRVHDHLWSILSGNEFQRDAEIIHELTRSGWDVTLFSNSPLYWSLPVAQAIGGDIKVHYDGLFLKPDVRGYMFETDKQHLYIDDSLRNLQTAGTLPNWTPVYFRNENCPKTDQYPTVASVWEIGLLCRSISEWSLKN